MPEPRQCRPCIGVGAIIVREGRVLLVRRGNEPGKGLWSVPGGKLEWGESLEDAVRREALEETSLVVEVVRLAGVSELRFPEDTGSPEYHYVLLDYVCRSLSGEPACASDAEAIEWFDLDAVEHLASTRGLAARLKEWLREDDL